MKKELEIHNEYIEYSVTKPWFFGKGQHWETYYEGYEMGYHDAVEEVHNSWTKELGLDFDNFPVDTDKQFDVMKEALRKYYQSKASNINMETL